MPVLRSRARSIASAKFFSEIKFTDSLEVESPVEKWDWSKPGQQLTVDEVQDETWTGQQALNPKHDRGGYFFSSRSYADIGSQTVSGVTEDGLTGITYEYTGSAHVAVNYNEPFPSSLEGSNDLLEEHGSTAIARCEPTNALADTSVALGELLVERGLPDIPLLKSFYKRADIVRRAGSEYLNVVFGWLPLKREVEAIAKAAADLDRLIDILEKQSGRPVRRRYTFDVESNITHDVVAENVSIHIGGTDVINRLIGDTGERGKILKTEETRIERWFAGAFTYYLPSDFESRSKIRKNASSARKILGIELTPDTLWNLAPWSWAVDWVSNSGDVVKNVSHFASNGLVMQYGYMMERTVHRITYTHVGPTGVLGIDSVPPVSFTTETKKRVPASPYGFGFDWSGISPFQSSILVSLGISRRR